MEELLKNFQLKEKELENVIKDFEEFKMNF